MAPPPPHGFVVNSHFGSLEKLSLIDPIIVVIGNFPDHTRSEGLDHCDGVADWLSWVDSSGGETWYQVNPHRFHLLTLEFFDFLNKERDAWEGVKDVKAWIVSQGRSSTSLGNNHQIDQVLWDVGRWSPQLIVTELGAVLKTKDIRAPGMHPSWVPPATHRRFSHLRFVQSGLLDGHVQQLDESDTGPGNESLVEQEESDS
ncbi:hypothetical protein MPER_04870 [Moniliophthora perniciosa FA553]|nr:hypothetical protein MPER_04870 [Moniliophthora perniciosa FA553]